MHTVEIIYKHKSHIRIKKLLYPISADAIEEKPS